MRGTNLVLVEAQIYFAGGTVVPLSDRKKKIVKTYQHKI